MNTYARVESDGITLESSSATEAELRTTFGLPDAAEAVPVADSEDDAAAASPQASAGTESATPDADAPEEPKKLDKRTREGRKASIQAEIDELTATKHTTRRELEAAQQELASLRAELTKLQKPAAPAPAPTQPAAKFAFPEYQAWEAEHKGASYEDYIDARQDARYRFNTEQEQRQQALTAKTQAFESRAAKFSQRFAAAKASDPEFVHNVDPRLLETPALSALPEGQAPTFGNFLVEQILDSEHPKELLVYLSNEAEVQRLATLPPNQVIRALASFEARLDAAPAKATSGPVSVVKPQSQAPPPVKPLGATPAVPDDDEYSDDEPVERYFARENAKRMKAIKGGRY